MHSRPKAKGISCMAFSEAIDCRLTGNAGVDSVGTTSYYYDLWMQSNIEITPIEYSGQQICSVSSWSG